MDRVFLDANVLFSAAYRSDSGLLKLWKLDIELITSTYALEEALLNLETRKQRERLERLVKDIVVIEGYADLKLPEGIELPEKDSPIFIAALESEATHLLTGDIKHFGPYFGKNISGVLILAPGEYFRTR